MISRKTLFILGAGSSCGYGYPIGRDLIESILREFPVLIEEFAKTGLPQNNCFKSMREIQTAVEPFLKKLSDSNAPSIDLFLTRHGERFASIGKLAIAFALMKAEIESNKSNFEIFKKSTDNWQEYLFDLMFKENTSLNEDNLPIIECITFNYDKSFQYAFRRYVKNNFENVSEVAIGKMLNVTHVYGALRENANLDDRYGKYMNASELLNAAGCINVLYDSREDLAGQIQGYAEWLNTFQQIFILGFAFEKVNLGRLGISKYIKEVKIIHATTYKMMEGEVGKIKSKMSAPHIVFNSENIKCRPFLEKYLVS